MMSSSFSLLMVGCGHMGGALLRGLVKVLSPESITVVTTNNNRSLGVKGVCHLQDSQEARLRLEQARGQSIVLFAVKPQDALDVLPLYKDMIGSIGLSVMAGVSLASLKKLLGTMAVVRLMPNMAVGQGKGVIGAVTKEPVGVKTMVETLLKFCGTLWWLDKEEEMHVLTALTGSGAGFVAAFLQALVEAAKQEGLSPWRSLFLTQHLLKGTAAWMEHTWCKEDKTLSFYDLQQRIASRGGITEAGLQVFGETLKTLCQDAIKAAVKQSRTMDISLSNSKKNT